MKTAGRFLAALCAILFVATGVLALLLFNLEQKAFSSETYKQAFQDQGLYEQAPALIAGLLTNSTGETPLLLSVLGRDKLEFMIGSLIPPDQLEALVDGILDSMFAFINGESNAIAVSLAPIKQHLSGDAGVRAFKQVLQASPDCTAEQLVQFALGGLSTDEGLVLCNPPSEVMDFIEPLISPQIQSMMLGIPDEITIPVGERGQARQFIERLDRIRAIMQLSLLVPITFLFLILLFAVRSINDLLKWWGIPFAIMGGLSALLALIGAPFIRLALDFAFQQGESPMPAVFLDLLPDMAGSLAKQILKPLAIEGIFLAVIGTVMLIALRFKNRAAQAADIASG
jgi:hypothetical protein